ncbi:MAG TPA: acyl carrier protein [Pirellulales bacterium]|nr:acyl carrier protein [Pirellulales bacterium]
MATDARTNQSVDTAAIREILALRGSMPIDVHTLDDAADLYAAGLTSLATVGLMLALEDRFDVEFPEGMLSRATFRSIQSIADAIGQLTA